MDGWVHITEGAISHRKQYQAGPEACWLWVCIIAHCQDYRTDFIQEMRIGMVAGMTNRKAFPLARKLAEVGLLEKAKGGYRVHDYIWLQHPKDPNRRDVATQQVLLMEPRKAPFAWRSHVLGMVHRELPRAWHAPGCYAIYLDGKLAYIGQSEVVRLRLTTHCGQLDMDYDGVYRTPWGPAKVVTLKFKPSRRFGDWLMREARLIRRLRPRGNRFGINTPLKALPVREA